jgi:hypothetical protein
MALLVLAAVAGWAPRAVAQQPVMVRTAGPGPVAPYLATVLAGPHRLVPPGPEPALLSRDSTYSTPVIVLGRSALIEGRVHGDVVVVGGDAFVRPGANVEGRVVAIGGGAYGSRLALVREGLESHRDFTYDVVATGDGYALDYRLLRAGTTPIVSLPGIYGVGLPNYDRSDGLSLTFGPLVSLDTGRVELEPSVTYRSHIGAVDPALVGRVTLSRHARVILWAGRGTFTNDDWIWPDIVNAGAVLAVGTDTRNYYRSDRVEGSIFGLWRPGASEIEPFVGARVERDRPIGPDSLARGGPWSLFGRRSREKILRFNPPAQRGTLRSALAGARWTWEGQGLRAALHLSNEAATFSEGDRRFLQSTLDGELHFPTVRKQRFWVAVHVVHTFGDTAPPQRWSYLGGSGTLATFDLLSMGGDQLLYVESNYYIPVRLFELRILGSPSITLRHAIGAAGIGRLPALEQNVSARVALSFVRLGVDIDPARRRTSFSAGLSITR